MVGTCVVVLGLVCEQLLLGSPGTDPTGRLWQLPAGAGRLLVQQRGLRAVRESRRLHPLSRQLERQCRVSLCASVSGFRLVEWSGSELLIC